MYVEKDRVSQVRMAQEVSCWEPSGDPQGSTQTQHTVRKRREPTGNNGHSAEPLAPRRPAARASQTATGRSSRWSLTSGNADERAT